MLKSFLPLTAAILFALTPTLSKGNAPQDTSPEAEPAATEAPAVPATATNPIKPTAESRAKAKNLYQIDCTMCHNDNGDGKTDVAKGMSLTVPDFTDQKAMSQKQDGELFNIIRAGKGKMPPEVAGRANDNMVWNLVLYIRNMSKSSASAN
jgi:mono/diheme cytochrome c family protein